MCKSTRCEVKQHVHRNCYSKCWTLHQFHSAVLVFTFCVCYLSTWQLSPFASQISLKFYSRTSWLFMFFPSIAWKPDSIIHLLESDAKYLVASTIYHVFTWPMFLFVEPPVSVIFSVLVGTVETPIGASWVDPPVENNYPKEDNSTTVITVRGTLDFLDVLQVRGPGAANQIMDDVLFQMSRLERYIPIHGSSYITYITHDDFRVPYLSGVCSWRFLMLLIHFGRYRWVRWVTKSWKLSNIFDPAHCEIWTWFEKITDSKNRTWY